MLNSETAVIETETETAETVKVETVGVTVAVLSQALSMMEVASKDPMRANLCRVVIKKTAGKGLDLWATNGHSMTHAFMMGGMAELTAGQVYYIHTETAPMLKLLLRRFKKDPGAMITFEQRGDSARYVFEGVDLWKDNRGEFPIQQVEELQASNEKVKARQCITLSPDLISQVIKAFNTGRGDGLKIWISDEKSPAFIEYRPHGEAEANQTALIMPMRTTTTKR